jgi:hypothetical protein
MKKFYLSILACCMLYVSSFGQTNIPTTDELILPRFAYYGASTGAGRFQYACRLTLTGLTANKTYKFYNGLSASTGTVTNAAGLVFSIQNDPQVTFGNIIGVGFSRNIANTLGSDEVSGNRHATFTTDANGNYTGWFATAANGNATDHLIDGDARFYIHVFDGATNTSVGTYRTTSTIKLLNYTTTSTGVTGLVGSAPGIGNEKFVVLYDDRVASSRPLYATWTENDGLNTSAQFTGWYQSINGISEAWGALIPNDLASGVRSIEYLNIDGTSAGTARTSTDGIFGGVSTVNPNLGSTSTAINLDPTILPITLTSFTGEAQNSGVRLNWATSSEINNQYFEILRGDDDRNFVSLGRISGAGNSSENKSYSFTDFNPINGNNYYQLKQVDFDGKSTTFGPIPVSFGLAEESFKLASTSESSVTVNITSAEAKQAEISYVGLDGRVLYKQSTLLTKGLNVIDIPVNKSTGNIGIISLRTDEGQKSLKVGR